MSITAEAAAQSSVFNDFATAPYEDILLICASKTRDFSREILDYTT